MSAWISSLADGDERAARAIFDRYYDRVVRLAYQNLRHSRRRAADEEDIALGSLASFLLGAADGKYPNLKDRDDLWRLLTTITVRKAAAEVRKEKRLKRGAARVRGESVFFAEGGKPHAAGLDRTPGSDLTPELAALLSENCQELLERLHDDTLRSIALDKLEGYSHKEIAQRIGRVEETVNRKVRRIREIWSQEAAP